MYVFSVSAKTRKAIEGFAADDQLPFIIYINFKDLLGAEQLCHLYLEKGGFYDIVIEKRKMIAEKYLQDNQYLDADKALKEAFESGYSVQLFAAH